MSHLPTDPKARKDTPVQTGCLDYFPKTIAAVARLSLAGNRKHNPGEPLHWSREKSNDHADCIARHQLERGTFDSDGFLHEVHTAWRAMAQCELALEKLEDMVPPASLRDGTWPTRGHHIALEREGDK